MGKLFVVGIGPGGIDLISERGVLAIKKSNLICGYKRYVELITDLINGKEIFTNIMKGEMERVKFAINRAKRGDTVSLVCGGDASLYSLASLVFEMSDDFENIEVIPGITAAMAASAKLGAPICEDIVFLSLSDLLTPWKVIERRVDAINFGDFVTAIYNPRSKKRKDYLKFVLEKFYQERGDLICGVIRNCEREDEEVKIWRISEFEYDFVDMSTIIIVGNTKTYLKNDKMITSRGYLDKYKKFNVQSSGFKV
ncbi:precorrin-3B C(17)-methyltransferase [Deferribacter abyssi]|uniref:precorrin-3B C(17)-methyltransferase n=1 Tax=Deferribacter abyssi TaxID=213806 RepID=UPI003C248882